MVGMGRGTLNYHGLDAVIFEFNKFGFLLGFGLFVDFTAAISRPLRRFGGGGGPTFGLLVLAICRNLAGEMSGGGGYGIRRERE